jgi:hypothetical protein
LNFGGLVAGFGVPGAIDFADIAFGPGTTVSFGEADGNSSGTLTLSDNTHRASIILLGQYATGNFLQHDDGHGGTLITDSPVVTDSLLAQAHV